jgi:predicted enzyme related to lactoylglutathione lyase
MPEISKYKPGTFCWPELATSDTAGAKKFYKELFGWKTEDDEIGPDMVYTMAFQKDKNVGAMFQLNEEMKKMGIPPNWLQYVSVGSVDNATAKAKKLGGAVAREPMDVMDIGRMSVLQDPTGATIALWEPKTAIGAELINEHGAIAWNELLTNDVDRAGKFYTDLFGWSAETQDMGGFNYTSFANGDRPAGGMMAITKDMGEIPPHWNQYFGIDDCDKGVDKITKLGGTIFTGPRDIPEVGRFAVATDPQGAVFSIIKLLNPQSA